MAQVSVYGNKFKLKEFCLLEKVAGIGFAYNHSNYSGPVFNLEKSQHIVDVELQEYFPISLTYLIYDYVALRHKLPLTFHAYNKKNNTAYISDAKVLLPFSKSSKIGKNNTTVLDTNLRSSKEIAPSQFNLDPRFMKLLKDNLDILRLEMTKEEGGVDIDEELEIIPHKFIIYSPGDFFAPHLDSQHGNGKNMLMTMSVEIAVDKEIVMQYRQSKLHNWNYANLPTPCASTGGNLFIDLPNYNRKGYGGVIPSLSTPHGVIPDNYFKIPEVNEKNNIRCALFYHDLLHCVSQLSNGYKLVLTCDIVQKNRVKIPKPTMLTRKRKSIEQPFTLEMLQEKQFCLGLTHLKSLGFKRIGFILKHKYFNEIPTLDGLKGFDKKLSKLMSSLIKHPRIIIIPISQETDNSSKDLVFHSDMINILSQSSAFTTLYLEKDEDDEKEDKVDNDKDQENVEISESKCFKLMENEWFQTSNAKKITPNYDTSNYMRMIKDTPEYRLGDAAFIKLANSEKTMMYTGSTEVHLGNEGFGGEIYESLAIIAYL